MSDRSATDKDGSERQRGPGRKAQANVARHALLQSPWTLLTGFPSHTCDWSFAPAMALGTLSLAQNRRAMSAIVWTGAWGALRLIGRTFFFFFVSARLSFALFICLASTTISFAMAPTKTWLSAVGLCLISSAAANRLGVKTFTEPQSHSEANLAKFTKPSSRVHVGRVDGVSRRQDEGCFGTCASCFGDNYQECANDESLCYDPNDPTTGCDSFVPDIPDFPDFDDIDLPGGTEWCSSADTCAECFGDGFELCPGSTILCWNPNDPTTGCDDVSEDDLDGYPGETEWCTSGDTCAECFGSGYELCPGSSIMCWNPDLPSTSAGCDDMDGGIDDDEDDTGDDDADVDDDDDSITDDDDPTGSDDPVPTLPSSASSPTADATSGSDDDETDGPISGGGDTDEVSGDSSDDDDDDDSAAAQISSMSILPVIVGAVGVAALL